VLALNDLVEVAMRAAARAARHIRAASRPAASEWTEKGRHDFVTDVDRAAEALIDETLRAATPESRVLGEELSPEAARDADLVWVVDPLDGTTNFLHGYPQYAVSIAGVVRGELSVGVVHDVERDSVYRAVLREGAWLGDERLAVSTETEPRRALIGTGFPFKELGNLRHYLAQFARVIGTTSGVRRAGSAALDLADVAAGRLDGFWEQTLAPWDVAAGALLIREAGGVITRPDGAADVVGHGAIVAGNPKMHAWLMGVLQEA
jgi:myo-inositol-1(or 4)-monophosphatase